MVSFRKKSTALSEVQIQSHAQSSRNLYLLLSVTALIISTVISLLIISKKQLIHNNSLFSDPLFGSINDAIMGFAAAPAHISPSYLILASIAIVLACVLIFARILYAIDRQPKRIGAVYFILSTLIAIFAAAIYFGFLSVNIHLLAIRSIEYITFLVSLIMVIHGTARKRHAWALALAITFLSILFVSNTRYGVASLAGALIMFIIYASIWSWRIAGVAMQWFAVSLIAALIALIIRLMTSTLHFYTNIPTLTFTNIIPFKIIGYTHLPLIGIGYLLTLFLASSYMTFLFIRASLVSRPAKDKSLPLSPVLAVMLISTSIAASMGHIFMSRSTPTGLIYCFGLIAIAVTVSATTFNKSSTVNVNKLILICATISTLLMVIVAVWANSQNTRNNTQLELYQKRNNNIVNALKNRHVSFLIGDYWRTSPIVAQLNKDKPKLVLVDNCTNIRGATGVINSSQIKTSSFAYVLTLDDTQHPQKSCTLKMIEEAFGEPNAGIIIAGTPTHPNEVLLFYDKGTNTSGTKPQQKPLPSTLISELNGSDECKQKTIMAVVAHQDDDILFMNPDMNTKIQAGYCIRTMYLTAGDNGAGNYYWLQRRQGAEAAYNTMLGKPDQPWIEKNVQLPNNDFLTIASPVDNSHISLIFTGVPDGKPGGEGFDNHAFQTLDSLWEGRSKQLQTVDGISSFDAVTLTNTIKTLMSAYQPIEIWGQSSKPGTSDHSDHRATGLFTQKAYTAYTNDLGEHTPIAPLYTYIGYPIRTMPENVFDTDRDIKMTVFLSYAQHDTTICRPSMPCNSIGTYIDYISRQYREEPAVVSVSSVRQSECSIELCRFIN